MSYRVTCHNADTDEVKQIWQPASVLICEGFNPVKAEGLMEPHVIFKLLKALVNKPLIICDPVLKENKEKVEEVEIPEDLAYFNAKAVDSEVIHKFCASVIKVTVKNCPLPTTTQRKEEIRKEIHIEIRPIVRLFKKSSPSPEREAKKKSMTTVVNETDEANKTNRLTTTSSPLRQKKLTDSNNQNVNSSKFSASYSSSKEGFFEKSRKMDSVRSFKYQEYRSKDPLRSSILSSYNLTPRARSEFRERSTPFRGRSYVSLYS